MSFKKIITPILLVLVIVFCIKEVNSLIRLRQIKKMPTFNENPKLLVSYFPANLPLVNNIIKDNQNIILVKLNNDLLFNKIFFRTEICTSKFKDRHFQTFENLEFSIDPKLLVVKLRWETINAQGTVLYSSSATNCGIGIDANKCFLYSKYSSDGGKEGQSRLIHTVDYNEQNHKLITYFYLNSINQLIDDSEVNNFINNPIAFIKKNKIKGKLFVFSRQLNNELPSQEVKNILKKFLRKI